MKAIAFEDRIAGNTSPFDRGAYALIRSSIFGPERSPGIFARLLQSVTLNTKELAIFLHC